MKISALLVIAFLALLTCDCSSSVGAASRSAAAVGDKIVVFNGRLSVVATVLAVEGSGKLKVRFAAGGSEGTIEAKQVRLVLPKTPPKFGPKDHVLVVSDGEVVGGKVSFASEGSYRIIYDEDGSSGTVDNALVLGPFAEEALTPTAKEGPGKARQEEKRVPREGDVCERPGHSSSGRWCDGACVDITGNDAHCGGCAPCKSGYHCDGLFCRDANGNLP
jgi:hypothetical protein